MAEANMSEVVRTKAGAIRGTTVGGAQAFLGVPYAAAPIGDRRFARPEPPEHWDGIRDADEFGPTAPQPQSSVLPQRIIEGDGYLHVNVYTPELGAARLPVFVWVHGGGMVMGSNAEPWDQGARLAERGMVVVAPNYRLGVDGFLSLPDAVPNRGVLDWLRALEWVQENVAAFGGDPDNVTVGGYSAGSAASLVLMASPKARGLFRRVIAISGVPWLLPDLDLAAQKAQELTQKLGVERTVAGVSGVERAALLAVQNELAPVGGITDLADPLGLFHRIASPTDLGWLGPVIDGDTIVEAPVEAFRRGVASDAPLLIGCTAQEMDALMGVFGATTDLETATSALGRVGLEPAGVDRWFAALEARSPAQVLGAALTVLNFRLPLLRVAEARFDGPAPTYVYQVAWAPPTPMGAVHGFDVPFAFANHDIPGVEIIAGVDPPASLAHDLSAALERFVCQGDASWPAYEAEDRSTVVFDVPSRVTADPDAVARDVFGSLR